MGEKAKAQREEEKTPRIKKAKAQERPARVKKAKAQRKEEKAKAQREEEKTARIKKTKTKEREQEKKQKQKKTKTRGDQRKVWMSQLITSFGVLIFRWSKFWRNVLRRRSKIEKDDVCKQVALLISNMIIGFQNL